MSSYRIVAGALCLTLVGCQGDDSRWVAVEDNDLAITDVEIVHTAQGGDRLLVVRGVDEAGQPIAEARLRTGRVLYAYEEGAPGRWSDGFELTLSAGEITETSVVPDRVPHAEVEPQEPTLTSLVRLRAVASAIEAEAGITFRALPRPEPDTDQGETPYWMMLCSSYWFGPESGGAPQCCANSDGTNWVSTVHNLADGGGIRFRVPGAVCTNSGGGTGCGAGGSGVCYYGPCGWHSNATITGPDPIVFEPHLTSWCGWDTDASGGGSASPEHYSDQWVFPDRSAACTCTGCLPDGTPTPAGCVNSDGAVGGCNGTGGGCDTDGDCCNFDCHPVTHVCGDNSCIATGSSGCDEGYGCCTGFCSSNTCFE